MSELFLRSLYYNFRWEKEVPTGKAKEYKKLLSFFKDEARVSIIERPFRNSILRIDTEDTDIMWEIFEDLYKHTDLFKNTREVEKELDNIQLLVPPIRKRRRLVKLKRWGR